MPNFNIEKIRKDTPACLQKIHLNNAGASLQPLAVVETVREYFELEAVTGGYEAAALKAKEIADFYVSIAQLLNCKTTNIAYTTNATEAYNKALSSIPFEYEDYIITTDDDYASNQIAFLYLQRKLGVRIVRAAKLPEGGVDVDDVEQLIKKYNPKLVAITHVPTNSGLVQDVYTIGKLCEQYDILYLVDACQSVGQMEIDVAKMKCDFLSATFRKFLRGPRGTGFLYVSDKVLDMDLEAAYPDLGGADWNSEFDYELNPTAKRFEYWERNFSNVLGAKTAVEYALKIGLSNIEERVKMLAAYTRNQFSSLTDFRILDRGTELCGIVTLHAEGCNWKALKDKLATKNINISVLTSPNAFIDFQEKGVEWMLRISPHYYNTKTEIDTLISETIISRK